MIAKVVGIMVKMMYLNIVSHLMVLECCWVASSYLDSRWTADSVRAFGLMAHYAQIKEGGGRGVGR